MSRQPADVLRDLPADKVLERLGTYNRLYLKWIEPSFSGTHLNLKLLRHAVESSLLDIARMKSFHGIEFADCHKRAAFSMLWITKAHPIQLATDVSIKETHLVINELYAIIAGLSHLDVDVTAISHKYLRNLIYILHFRNPAPEILASSMYLLDCAISHIQP